MQLLKILAFFWVCATSIEARAAEPVAVPPRPQAAPTALAAAGAMLDSAAQLKLCQELVQANDKKFFPRKSRVPEKMSKPGSEYRKQRCYPFQDVTFALLLSAFNDDPGNERWVADWTLVRIDGAGNKVPIVSGPAGGECRSQAVERHEGKRFRLCDTTCSSDDSLVFTIVKLYDFDNDGNPELVLNFHEMAYEADESYDVEIWSVRNNALVAYPHYPKTTAAEMGPPHSGLIADVDHDGRVDVYTVGPYGNVGIFQCGPTTTSQIVPAVFLLHSQPDGNFSESDPVAQQALKAWCPEPPSIKAVFAAARGIERDGLPSFADIAHVTVCARAWGKNAEQVLSELAPGCYKLADSTCEAPLREPAVCPEWLTKLNAITPRVRLR